MLGESLSQLRSIRLDKIEALKAKGIAPYPTKSARTHFSAQVVDNFDVLEEQEVIVAGRLMSRREQGALSFAHIQDAQGKIQLFLRKGVVLDEAGLIGYEDLNLLDVGDFVEGQGKVMRTKRGEISILVDRLRILSKSLRPLPEKWSGVTSPEIIRRKRYLHTIMEPEALQSFTNTSDMIFAMRDFLVKKGFKEFQTPILQPMYGGGTAKPFTTHLNAFDCRMFLAISHELYLKRLVIAGYDNVFTVGRYFRNEGVDATHNPEFSMLETMSAYQNYEYNMDLVEQLFHHVATNVFGKEEYEWRGQTINMGKAWRRISMKDAVLEYAGIDFEKWGSAQDAMNELSKHGVKEPVGSVGEGLALAYEELVGPKLIDPHIVYGHPIEISPLAKPNPEDPRFVERFEIVIGGMECGDNWTEQNDPVALRDRWIAARELASSLGADSHPMDTDFLEALEYGMPPTTGLGPGLERMAMLFTGSSSINDVLFFPTVKPLVEEEDHAKPLSLSLENFEELASKGAFQPGGTPVRIEASVETWTAGESTLVSGTATLHGFLNRPVTLTGYLAPAKEGVDGAKTVIDTVVEKLKSSFPSVAIAS